MIVKYGLFLLAFAPAVLLAESAMPGIRFTGAPTDGGQNCGACHTSSRKPTGSVTLDVADYTPGIAQPIHVTIGDPQATRWGFELTARSVSDETGSAGTFMSGGPPVQIRCDDGSRFGAAPPCSGLRQFAEHLNAPNTASGAGFTFDVMWLPPAPEIGRVVFYVSAVAADGDGSPLNDSVYTISKTVAAVGSCPNSAKPTLTKAVNGASFQAPFSSNALMTVFGLGFADGGTKRSAGLGDFDNGAFPTQLSCVAVEMSGVRVPITYVQQDQINIQAPALSPSASVSLTVILNPGKPNELRSDVATQTAQAFAPAFFTFTPGGVGSIAAQFANTNVPVSGARPAKPGDIVTLYGTGFGDTNPSVATGQLATAVSPLRNSITVSLGGVPLTAPDVLYAGLSPGSISGLYQFNVRIPASAPTGDVPVVITIGGAQTQPGATIPIQQ